MVQTPLKIVFAGTPQIARHILAAILAHDFAVSLVLTQPDRPAGRGLKLAPSPVKELALEHNLPLLQPRSLRKDPAAIAALQELQPDIMIVVAYGLILPPEVLAIPRLGCINIHVSLLPRWRGAAPIQRAILAGDSKSGVSIMQMDAGLDTGPVCIMSEVALSADETAGSLHDKLAELGALKLIEYLKNPQAYPPISQATTGESYAAKIEKEEACLNFSEAAVVIERKIRGFNPVPGAYCYLNGVLHKIWGARLLTAKISPEPAGTIVELNRDGIVVVCGDGHLLQITELQEAGGKRKTSAQYLQARPQILGSQFRSEAS